MSSTCVCIFCNTGFFLKNVCSPCSCSKDFALFSATCMWESEESSWALKVFLCYRALFFLLFSVLSEVIFTYNHQIYFWEICKQFASQFLHSCNPHFHLTDSDAGHSHSWKYYETAFMQWLDAKNTLLKLLFCLLQE